MPRPLVLLLAAALLAAAPAPARAQGASGGDDRWQAILTDDAIVWDFRIVRLDGEQLVVRQRDSTFTVPVQQLRELRLIRKSDLRLGAGGGGGMAALLGTDDEVFDLGPLEFAERLRMLQQILLLHPPAAAKPPS